MKLISCYIENFGCISNKEYVFDEKLTVINQENGFGKSTLVAFIKAMFYGLDSYKVNSLGFSDRLHYYPFAGGLFGGNLTFLFNGKEYKIERFFAEKSGTGDSLRVYLNGSETDELGLDIGKTVFGLDKESFERVIFVSSGEIEIKSTSSINAKLGEFLEGNIDDVSVDDAKDKLVTAQKRYKKSNKAVSEITKTQDLILELNNKIANVKSVSISLEQKNQVLIERESEIKQLSNKIIDAQKLNKQISDYENYENLLSLARASNEKIDEIKAKYKNGIPAKKEIEKVGELLIKNRELLAKKVGDVSSEELDFYNAKSKVFAQGTPDEEVFSKVLSEINRFTSLEMKKKALNERVFSEKEKLVLEKFSRNTPKEEVVSETERLIEEYKGKSQQYQMLGDLAPNKPNAKGGIISVCKALAITLAVVGVLGVASLFINAILGGCLLGVSVLGLLAVGFIYLNKKSSAVQGENVEKLKLKYELSSLEDKIKNTLAYYGYLTGSGVVYDYIEFKNSYELYLELIRRDQVGVQELETLDIETSRLQKWFNGFFEKFGILSGNYFERLTALKGDVSKYLIIKQRVENADKNAVQIKAEIDNNNQEINDFYAKYGVSNVALSEIIADVNALDNESENFSQLTLRASEYKEQKNILEKPQGESVDLTYLNETLINLQDSVALLKRSIDADETEVDKLGGYESDKRSAEEMLALYKQKHKILVATEDFLSLAEQNLKDKYVKPVKDDFLVYANVLEKVLGEKVIMTKDFEVNFERNGKPRSEKHLSSGQKSICALCFRLALINNMYKNIKPFIVLDDPFVHLDKEHLSKVKTLIESLSNDMQILYFTCHESRELN